MKSEIVIAIIGALPALITAVISIIMNNRVLGYKIDELSKRVEKHNQIVERTFRLEEKTTTLFNDVTDLKSGLERLEDHLINS